MGGFGHGEGRHRGGRRRMFDAGELRLVLLLLLEAQPRHGYDFIREIEERTGGAYAPSPGVVYPTLTMLEDLSQIEETQSEGPKRLYALTAAGRAQLEERRVEAEAAMARLVALGAESSRIETGPVWRAMQNLKTVLQQQLGEGRDKQMTLDVAELIDEAARKIERL
ncbi:PadR family transcriptional regulator [Humitalea rosea]|uniref:PadR family transcriptional regulator n=2 Tax=Humitalea rosea TaxID=990373 RepID=A0A2W7HUR7_9PROT|nr:PadR family transcriptional regulator [Humitalea rosea]